MPPTTSSKTAPVVPATTPAPAKAAATDFPTNVKPTLTDEQWSKMNLEEKLKARETNELSETQADDLEALEEAAYHKDMLKKLSSKRIPRVVSQIRSVGGLAIHNPSEAQQKAMIDALTSAVEDVKAAFQGKNAGFELPE